MENNQNEKFKKNNSSTRPNAKKTNTKNKNKIIKNSKAKTNTANKSKNTNKNIKTNKDKNIKENKDINNSKTIKENIMINEKTKEIKIGINQTNNKNHIYDNNIKKTNKVDNYINDIFEKENKKQIKDSTFSKKAEIKESFINKEKVNTYNYLIIIIVTLIIIIISLFIKTLTIKCDNNTETNNGEQNIQKEIIIDENILFLGNSILEDYDIDKYFPSNKVVKNIIDISTEELLSNMKNNIYVYNPSKTVLLIGNNDIKKNIPRNEIIKNTKQIINEIILNRNLSEIIVVSIFPVDEIEKVKYINYEIEEFCDDKNIKYINVYEDFIEKNYYNDQTISKKGYQLLTSKLIKNINKNNQ